MHTVRVLADATPLTARTCSAYALINEQIVLYKVSRCS